MRSSNTLRFSCLTMLLCLPEFALPDRPLWTNPLTGQLYVSIEAGCFNMGNPDALKPDRSDYPLLQLGYNPRPFADEAPVFEACVESFWVAQTEVTAAQWQQVMGTPPPEGEGQQPAGGISWSMANAFVAAVNNKASSQQFRLPTEAEWEYLCQLGFPDGPPTRRAEYQPLAWYNLLGERMTTAQPVASKSADHIGLFDTLGNVWEWTQDTYDAEAYINHSRHHTLSTKPTGSRVIRGGSFRSPWQEVRCQSRANYPENANAIDQLGLRLVRDDRK